MKRLPWLLFVLVAFTSFATFAQTSAEHKTDVNKDVDVVKVYEQVVTEGYGTPFIYERLANAYYFRNEYKQAKKWFEKLFDEKKPTDATLKHRYKQTLKALDLYKSPNHYLSVINQDDY